MRETAMGTAGGNLRGSIVRNRGHRKGAALASGMCAAALLVPMLVAAAPADAGVGRGCSLDTASSWPSGLRTCSYIASGPGVYEGHSAPYVTIPMYATVYGTHWAIRVNGSPVAQGGVKAGNLPTKSGDLVEVDLTPVWATAYARTPGVAGRQVCMGRGGPCFNVPGVPSVGPGTPVYVAPSPGSITARDLPSR